MRSTQENGLALDEVRILENSESPGEPSAADASRMDIDRKSEAIGVIFQLLVTAYAVFVLVITLRRYTNTKGYVGLTSFFIGCTAIFYIVFYNALSIEQAFKRWIDRHYPTLRWLSIVLALVLATVPIGTLYLMPSEGAKLSRSAPVQSTPAIAPTPTATVPKIEAVKVAAPETVSEMPASILVLRDVRYQSGASSTRVTVDIDGRVQYEINRLANPDRIYLDFRRVKLDRGLWSKRFQVTDSALRAIRIAEHEGNVTRLTLETKHFCDYFLSTVGEFHKLQLELKEPVRAEMR